MKKSYSLVLAILLLCSPSILRAQELETGYFLGGNPYAFRLNPAFQSERSIFSVALGQTGLGAWSNLGASTLLYPSADGTLYTFLNDQVNTTEFLRKISNRNSIDLDARVNLLTLGFWSDRTYITLDFNVRSLNALSIPYDVFSFLKEGTETRDSFDFSGLAFQSDSFIEAAFGWSRNFDDVFNAGFRLKGLVGVLEAGVRANSLKLTAGAERWTVQSESVLNASSPSLSYTCEDGYIDSVSLDDDRYGPAGFGGAVDFGFSWNVQSYLTLSASVLDLGVIYWNREIKGISPDTTYEWAPGESGSGTSGDWEAEIDAAANSLSGIFRFEDASQAGSPQSAMLPFRVLVGAELRAPFYERLSIGALYQARGGDCYARHTGRFSLNWNPFDFLSLSTGTTVNKLGESIGVALNLHPAGVNLMLGCDYVPFNCINISSLIEDIPDQYRKFALIPRDQLKLNLYVGLNFAFGQSRLDHAKRFDW